MTNELIPGNTASMTSLEIAELVGKRHDNVKRTIETLAAGRVIAQPQIEDERGVDALGRSRSTQVYRFAGDQGKRDSYVVVAQLCPEFTATLVDRWQELESRQQIKLPNRLETARMLVEALEENQVLQIENQQQSEKITSLESLFKEGMTVTQFCKGLNGVNVMAVNECLLGRNWLYNVSKSGTRWRVGSYARDRYLTEHQHEITPHGQEPFIKYTPVLLRKGAARLHELYLAGELPMKKTWDGLFTHDKESRSAA